MPPLPFFRVDLGLEVVLPRGTIFGMGIPLSLRLAILLSLVVTPLFLLPLPLLLRVDCVGGSEDVLLLVPFDFVGTLVEVLVVVEGEDDFFIPPAPLLLGSLDDDDFTDFVLLELFLLLLLFFIIRTTTHDDEN